MPSNDKDIDSQAARQRTEQETLAVRLFSLFFTELEELRRLHEDALGELGPGSFLKDYREILKLYVLKLRPEARTALENDIVKVIESRGNRRAIAQRIVTLIAPEYEENVKPLDELAQNLVDWARAIHGLPDVAPDTTPEQAEYSNKESDDEKGGDIDDKNPSKEYLKTLMFANMEKACHFLQKSVPFQTLVLQLRLLCLPASLREIVETIPKCSIKISAENDTSLTNRFKAIIEERTATQWDWWPLTPRVPDVAPDRLRLEWRCCGQPLYREITSEEAESIRHILNVADDHRSECHCCKVPSSRPD